MNTSHKVLLVLLACLIFPLMEKTSSASAGTKAAKKSATEMVNRATESPNQAEKATNTVLSEPLTARKSRNNIEINVPIEVVHLQTFFKLRNVLQINILLTLHLIFEGE